MNRLIHAARLGLVLFCPLTFNLFATTNRPAIVDLNTPRAFPAIETRAQWESRAKEIREQVLVSCGLWPLPGKTPLRANVFGRIERDGYSVEKVYFQTYSGFYLAGNLYRPLGRGKGPFPGVLNPHGHWPDGRMADSKEGSVAARCISFARQGMVAFTFDMVGYHDTRFPDSVPPDPKAKRQFYHAHREFGTNHTDELWGISLMGLQTWNSIRALDFLASLPDVDKKRLACTGASGGGTQTFMLGAIDDRLAALSPVVMVSHSMQGGCSCENAPGLRVKYSNMEIAAAAAPCPQILVAATGDWTKTTPEIEGPAIQNIYDLLSASDRLRFVRFEFGHNYNQTSREAVYGWFGQWLLRRPDPALLKEQPYQKEADADLRVFPDDKLPADALPKEQFIESLKRMHRERWQALVPRNKSEFNRFKKVMLPAWQHTLQAHWPPPSPRGGKPASKKTKPIVLLVEWDDETGVNQSQRAAQPVWAGLRNQGYGVNAWPLAGRAKPANQFTNFFTTYNRTLVQREAGSLQAGSDRSPVYCGFGRAGIVALLTAPYADAVVADCDQLDVTSDETLLEPDLFCPGIRNIGTFEGAAMLAAPNPLLLHNTGDRFSTDAIRATYRALGASKKLRIESRKLSDDEIAEWISNLK